MTRLQIALRAINKCHKLERAHVRLIRQYVTEKKDNMDAFFTARIDELDIANERAYKSFDRLSRADKESYRRIVRSR